MTMTIHSNSVLLMRVTLAGQYKSFEHVQNICVPSTNNFHSCLCALKMCSYHLCRTAYMLYSSHSHCILCHSCMYHFRPTECKCDSIEKKRTESSSYNFSAISESFENDSHCYSHCYSYPYLLILARYVHFLVYHEKEPYII